MPKFKKLTDRQRIDVGKLLDEHVTPLEPIGGVRLCSYAEGWSDERIAQEVLQDYPGNGIIGVAAMRRALYGSTKIPKPPKPPPAPTLPLEDPVDRTLIDRVSRIEAYLDHSDAAWRDLGLAFLERNT